jgi:release factor glutamine methyltransferase
MTTVGEALAKGRASLQKDSEHPARDAVLLLAHVLDKPSEYPYLHPETALSDGQEQEYLRLVERRRAGEPVAYLRGYQEFMGMRFLVDRRVLIPRPETEILVGAALAVLGRQDGEVRIADAGCGSGAIGLSLARLLSKAWVALTDSSLDALEVARGNAASLGVMDRVRFFHGDLLRPLLDAGLSSQFDVLVSNPPYIPAEEMDELPQDVRCFEPGLALDGGPGGLAVIERIAAEAPATLRPGGTLYVEIGDGQGNACRGIFLRAGTWRDFGLLADYSGRQRVFTARTRSAGSRGDRLADQGG